MERSSEMETGLPWETQFSMTVVALRLGSRSLKILLLRSSTDSEESLVTSAADSDEKDLANSGTGLEAVVVHGRRKYEGLLAPSDTEHAILRRWRKSERGAMIIRAEYTPV